MLLVVLEADNFIVPVGQLGLQHSGSHSRHQVYDTDSREPEEHSPPPHYPLGLTVIIPDSETVLEPLLCSLPNEPLMHICNLKSAFNSDCAGVSHQVFELSEALEATPVLQTCSLLLGKH